jgi:1-deoxyxylulose-5-phosphate synthase
VPETSDSDKAIVDAVQHIARERNVSMATVAMAWVLKHPVVEADEFTALEQPYTPREPTYFN